MTERGEPTDDEKAAIREVLKALDNLPDWVRTDLYSEANCDLDTVEPFLRFLIDETPEKPCPVCGVEPGDPHNPEAHIAEMRADETEMYERDARGGDAERPEGARGFDPRGDDE